MIERANLLNQMENLLNSNQQVRENLFEDV
jgi:hypothetical protein